MTATCHAFVHSKKAKITGGKRTIVKIKNPKEWCEFYGVEVKNGVATVFKALNEDFSSNYDREFFYKPGSTPKAVEFDKKIECGKGLHFSPHPKMAKGYFFNEAKKFMACPIKLSEMVIHMEGTYPHKVKAPRLFKPCYEVDINGVRI